MFGTQMFLNFLLTSNRLYRVQTFGTTFVLWYNIIIPCLLSTNRVSFLLKRVAFRFCLCCRHRRVIVLLFLVTLSTQVVIFKGVLWYDETSTTKSYLLYFPISLAVPWITIFRCWKRTKLVCSPQQIHTSQMKTTRPNSSQCKFVKMLRNLFCLTDPF